MSCERDGVVAFGELARESEGDLNASRTIYGDRAIFDTGVGAGNFDALTIADQKTELELRCGGVHLHFYAENDCVVDIELIPGCIARKTKVGGDDVRAAPFVGRVSRPVHIRLVCVLG